MKIVANYVLEITDAKMEDEDALIVDRPAKGKFRSMKKGPGLASVPAFFPQVFKSLNLRSAPLLLITLA